MPRDKPSRTQQLEVEQLELREETGNKNTANKSLKEEQKAIYIRKKTDVIQTTTHTKFIKRIKTIREELRTEMQGAEQIYPPLILQLHISNLPAYTFPKNSQK